MHFQLLCSLANYAQVLLHRSPPTLDLRSHSPKAAPHCTARRGDIHPLEAAWSAKWQEQAAATAALQVSGREVQGNLEGIMEELSAQRRRLDLLEQVQAGNLLALSALQTGSAPSCFCSAVLMWLEAVVHYLFIEHCRAMRPARLLSTLAGRRGCFLRIKCQLVSPCYECCSRRAPTRPQHSIPRPTPPPNCHQKQRP